MVIIMRGVPGSGKSRWAEKKLKHFEEDPNLPPEASGLIVSADNYRMRHGKYVFDPNETPAAHQDCYDKAYKFLEQAHRHDLLIIDNTNISNWEMTPYACLGSYHRHRVVAVQVNCRPSIAWNRNTHGVPLEVITRMHESMEAPKTIKDSYIIDGEDTRTVVHIPW